MLPYQQTPLQEINDPHVKNAGVRLIIKREDLNHPFVSGNKWWKLKYNLEEAKRQGKKTLLTFGGAFSNHIHATAAAAHELQFQSIGIIRGERVTPLNPTLTFAEQRGMHLHFISRSDYSRKNEKDFIKNLENHFGDFYLIPEGGTNDLAIKGCEEFGHLLKAIPSQYIVIPVGTGGTISGIIKAFDPEQNIIGVSVLKGDFLQTEIDKLLHHTDEKNSDTSYGNWSVLTSYHHGGYGRVTPELLKFIQRMKQNHSLPLDPVYTGKLLWAVMEEIKKGAFEKGSCILVVHTGGLQGFSTLLSAYEEQLGLG